MNQRTGTKILNKTDVVASGRAVAQSGGSQQHSDLASQRSKLRKSSVWSLCLLSLTVLAFNQPASATDSAWKDGMMFTQEDVTSLQGHKAVKIVFGLVPGKCTGELTAVSEWLKMTQGTLVQTYPGKGDVQRVAGDEWFQENGTKVILCNKSGANAVLIGMQFKRE